MKSTASLPLLRIPAGCRPRTWTAGAPAYIRAETLAADRAAYSRRRCRGCHRKGMHVLPGTIGGRYVVRLVCPLCAFEEDA